MTSWPVDNIAVLLLQSTAQFILDKIFDPFFTTRDVGEGMGLGLAVSQTIIRAHNGELRARSVKGEWSEFSFDLALAPRTLA